MSLEQSLKMLHEGNRSLQIAGKEVEMAESEHRRTSSFWYPMLNVTGAYVHMSNPIEVKQPLNQFTDPAKDFIHSVLPDDQLISSILDKIGSYSLRFPLAPQNVSTIDANLTWPIFAGGKRIYAGRITRSMVSIAEENRGQVDATVQAMHVESYFAVRVGQRWSMYGNRRSGRSRSLTKALKLEANGMIDKAERLFVQVNMDEARRERNRPAAIWVWHKARSRRLSGSIPAEIHPVSPLFINDTLPAGGLLQRRGRRQQLCGQST